MNYWIFIAAPHKVGTESYTAKQIYDIRMEDHFWGLGAQSPLRKDLRLGDEVVFYIARPNMAFAGTARLASDCVELSAVRKAALSHESAFFTSDYGVELEAIETWETMRPIGSLSSKLKFVKKPQQFGTYLQGPIRKISFEDYSTIVKQMNWDLTLGQVIERKVLHQRFGASVQGGICPSSRSPNVLIFTDPAEGEQFGYIDGEREDGFFHYTGHGRKGDQKMTRGNAAILHHRDEGRALRLFRGARGRVQYEGEFEVDEGQPFYRMDALQRASTQLRKVIVFRLRRVSPGPSELEENRRAGGPRVSEVPIELLNSDSVLVHPKAEAYALRRVEHRLVKAYQKWMESKGSQIVRHRVYPEGETSPIVTDAYDKTRNNLLEAKGSPSRDLIRMAIGQLADYSRFVDPTPRLAVLLPMRPVKDLENLLARQHISVVWQTEGKGFEDNAGGVFI